MLFIHEAFPWFDFTANFQYGWLVFSYVLVQVTVNAPLVQVKLLRAINGNTDSYTYLCLCERSLTFTLFGLVPLQTSKLPLPSKRVYIAFHREPIAELLSITCHMGYHSATWLIWMHPTLTPAKHGGTWFSYFGGMEGWVELGDWLSAEMVCNTGLWCDVVELWMLYLLIIFQYNVMSCDVIMCRLGSQHAIAKDHCRQTITRWHRVSPSSIHW